MIYRWDEESHQTSKCSDCDVTNQHCTFRNCDAYADCHTSNCMKTDYMTCKGDETSHCLRKCSCDVSNQLCINCHYAANVCCLTTKCVEAYYTTCGGNETNQPPPKCSRCNVINQHCSFCKKDGSIGEVCNT